MVDISIPSPCVSLPLPPKSMFYNLQSSFTINNIDSVAFVIWTEWK